MLDSESPATRSVLTTVYGSAVYLIRSAVFKDSAILVIGNGIAAALGFLAAVIISRGLGPTSFGLISTAVAVTTVVTGLTDFGIGTGLVRFAARDLETNRAKASALLIGALKLELVLGLLILLSGAVLVRPLSVLLGNEELLVGPLAWAFAAGFGLSVAAYNNAVLQANLKFKRLAALMIIYGIAKFAGLLALIASNSLTVESVLILYAAAAMANLGIGFLIIPRSGIGKWNMPGQRAALSELFSFSKWVMLSFFINSLAGRLDILMLSHFRTAEDVGHYAAAFQLASVFPLIIGAVSTTLLPRVSRLEGAAQVARFIRRTLSVTGMLVMIMLPALLLSSNLIAFLFGDRYSAAVPSFQVLFAAFLFALFGNPTGLALYALDRAWVVTAINLGQMILTLALDLSLIPAYGSVGAAITFMLSTCFGLVLTAISLWRLLAKKEPEIAPTRGESLEQS